MKSSLRIIVSGLVAQYPLGGVAWDYLQYVVGLARLGHEVYYYEDTWSWPYDPLKKSASDSGEYSAQYLKAFFDQYAPELSAQWQYVHLHDKRYGMTREEFRKIAQSADLFLNISGACLFPDELSSGCIKVFLDTDPGYNQIIFSERPAWSENVDRWCKRVEAHDRHFTYAENIHGADCLVPETGLEWKTTRMPVVLDLWAACIQAKPPSQAPWTTVMSWNAFKGRLVHEGVEYHSKGTEFEKVVKLPGHGDVPFKVAVGGITTSLKWFERHGFERTSEFLSCLAQRRTFRQLSGYGWKIEDGPKVTLTPNTYQDFIAGSYGEVSVAKHVYVAMQTGWFSCRSACYLAAGKPVVVQETGFSNVLPVGKGLFAFGSLDEAVDAIKQVEADYDRHARAARGIAEEYFDSDKVLADLISDSLEGSDL